MFDKLYPIAGFCLTSYYQDNLKGKTTMPLALYLKLQCVFALKSLKKTNFEMFNAIKDEVTSDSIIFSHLSLEEKYWIFDKRALYPFSEEFKRAIFKFYSILVIKKIIDEIVINDGFKTYKRWSIEYSSFEINEIEKFNISFQPFKILKIESRFFLISSFFNLTTEIFKENSRSLKRFKLKEMDYLKSLCSVPLYFDAEAFDRVYGKFSSKLDSIEYKILTVVESLRFLREEMALLNKLMKKQYVQEVIDLIKKDAILINEISLLLPGKVYVLKRLKEVLPQIEWNIFNLNLVWNHLDVLNCFSVDLKSFTPANLDLIIKNHFARILELEFVSTRDAGQVVEKRIADEFIDVFLEKNCKALINSYKLLGLAIKPGEIYSNCMCKLRDLQMKEVEKQTELSGFYWLNNLKLINSIKDQLEGRELFFPFFYDFRGRMYVRSIIGVTEFKLSRLFFHYGWYSIYEISELDKVSIVEVDEFCSRIGEVLRYFGVERGERVVYESAFWAILAIGKEFLDKTNPSTDLKIIFMKGYQRLLAKNDEQDEEKWLLIEHYKAIIQSFSLNVIPKRFIHKDATASFIQNTIRILGPKNEKSLEYANLYSNQKWYDTYALSLNFWKKTLKIDLGKISLSGKLINADVLSYFTRRTIKKAVMTDSYAAKYLTQWDYFRSAVKEDFNISFEYKSEVELLFRSFIKFLEEIFWNEHFLASDPNCMVDYIEFEVKTKNQAKIVSIDSESDLIYYKYKTKSIDIMVKIPDSVEIYRKTKMIKIVDKSNIDLKKIKSAIKPNWVHFVDAYLVRQINSLMGSYLMTIHDCFLVDCLNVTNFILKANKAFKILDGFSIAKNRDILEKAFSIFIFF